MIEKYLKLTDIKRYDSMQWLVMALQCRLRWYDNLKLYNLTDEIAKILAQEKGQIDGWLKKWKN